jgi:hypothetical protein
MHIAAFVLISGSGVLIVGLGLYPMFTGSSPFRQPTRKGRVMSNETWRQYGRALVVLGSGIVILGVGGLLSGRVGAGVAAGGLAPLLAGLLLSLRVGTRVWPAGRPVISRIGLAFIGVGIFLAWVATLVALAGGLALGASH